ncbi:MAG TPA: choice-of-anchor Q domain-containing protein [Anaerolineae bacterium]|nr:choice-of-anchor Q domain-containing protein [Anaerolineae bacterium]
MNQKNRRVGIRQLIVGGNIVVFLLVLYVILWGALPTSQANTPVIYVDADSLDSNPDGSSWTKAYTNVQDALLAATVGDEIWVAEGVYYPDDGMGQVDDDVYASFELKGGVVLYGGFVATETMRSQRNPPIHYTILSGDLSQDDLPFAPTVDSDNNSATPTATDHLSGTNAYHVVSTVGLTNSTVLDGFIIMAGSAYGESPPHYYGGGMYNNNSDLILNDIIFVGNVANYGSGLFNQNSSPIISNVVFVNNMAIYGGGMFNADNSSPIINDTDFVDNMATDWGGGMVNQNNSSPVLSNTNFGDNIAANWGGGMVNQSNSNPTISNALFIGNSAANYGGGMYNDYSNPRLDGITFYTNTAGYGGALFNNYSSFIIARTLFQDNAAGSFGGAIYNAHSGLIISSTRILNNYANGLGGGMYSLDSNLVVSTTAVMGNSVRAVGEGGGLYNMNSTLTIYKSSIAGNSVESGGGVIGRGGGVYNISSDMSINDTILAYNMADHGAGLYNNINSNLIINNTTFDFNISLLEHTDEVCVLDPNFCYENSHGGGLYNVSDNVIISNTTFSNNIVAVLHTSEFCVRINTTCRENSRGGGVYSSGHLTLNNITFSNNEANYGGGIYVENNNVTMESMSFSNNQARDPINPTFGIADGGGLYGDNISLTIKNSIMANSEGGDCVLNGNSTLVDGGHNLIEDVGEDACNLLNGVNNNIVGIDPSLGPLADNGGPAMTHRPVLGSPAIDNGNCSSSFPFDQRGAGRVYGVSCDIGAVEVHELLTSSSCGVGELAGTYSFPFATGNVVSITVGVANGLDCITVEEMGVSHPLATDFVQTEQWWHVAGNIATGFDITMTLPYSNPNSMSRVCNRNVLVDYGVYGIVDGWDCGGEVNDTTFNNGYVTRSGIGSFSDWSVGHNGSLVAISPAVSITLLNRIRVELSWNDVSSNCRYDVYRSVNPYGSFVLWQADVTGFMVTDGTGVGDVANNYFYYVEATVCGGSDRAVSKRMGEFDYGIQAGS